MPPRKDGQKTKDRILEAACELFGSKGFHAATVGEISRKAACNIAAINYHFGSKAQLYSETWRFAHRQAHDLYVAIEPSPELPAEERLRAYILFLLSLLSNDEELKNIHMLHEREFLSPTGLVDDLWRELRRPVRECVFEVISAILGDEPPKKDVELCEVLVVSLCHSINKVSRRQHSEYFGDTEINQDFLKKMADDLTCFAVAGIKALRERRGRD